VWLTPYRHGRKRRSLRKSSLPGSGTVRLVKPVRVTADMMTRPYADAGERSRFALSPSISAPARQDPNPTTTAYNRPGRRSSHVSEPHTATFTPSMASSPWIRRYPHSGFSFTSRNTSIRIEWTVRGWPVRFGRLVLAWWLRIRSRCQRTTMSGPTRRCRRCSTAERSGQDRATGTGERRRCRAQLPPQNRELTA